jgi:RsiW-degrading membrane proteinase PrsW (M82 family)
MFILKQIRMDIIKIASVPMLVCVLLYMQIANVRSFTHILKSLYILLIVNFILIMYIIDYKIVFDNIAYSYIINVGFKEELSKFLSFVVVAQLLGIKNRKELLACFISSHVLFAFMENILYYLDDPSSADRRFIVGVLYHGSWGVIQAITLYHSRKLFILALLLCAVWHGIHDTLVVTGKTEYIVLMFSILCGLSAFLLSTNRDDIDELYNYLKKG